MRKKGLKVLDGKVVQPVQQQIDKLREQIVRTTEITNAANSLVWEAVAKINALDVAFGILLESIVSAGVVDEAEFLEAMAQVGLGVRRESDDDGTDDGGIDGEESRPAG